MNLFEATKALEAFYENPVQAPVEQLVDAAYVWTQEYGKFMPTVSYQTPFRLCNTFKVLTKAEVSLNGILTMIQHPHQTPAASALRDRVSDDLELVLEDLLRTVGKFQYMVRDQNDLAFKNL